MFNMAEPIYNSYPYSSDFIEEMYNSSKYTSDEILNYTLKISEWLTENKIGFSEGIPDYKWSERTISMFKPGYHLYNTSIKPSIDHHYIKISAGIEFRKEEDFLAFKLKWLTNGQLV